MGLLLVTRIVFLKVHSSWQYRKWYLHLRQTFAKEKGSTNYQWSTETVTSSLAHIFHQGSVRSHACVEFTVYRDFLIWDKWQESKWKEWYWVIFTFYGSVSSNFFCPAFWCSLIFIVCGRKCIEKWWICDHVFFSFTIKAPRGCVFVWASCQPIRVYCWGRSRES